jgi:dihydrofolate reductase
MLKEYEMVHWESLGLNIKAIAATNRQGIIGLNNGIPWNHKEDMKRFKELTLGHTVIMGRKTWDSLPSQFRPLPERENKVLSYQDSYVKTKGVGVYKSVQDAFESCNPKNDVWIIGGGEVYAKTLCYCSEIYLTVVPDILSFKEKGHFTYFPALSEEWHLGSMEDGEKGLKYLRFMNLSFINYENRCWNAAY